MAKTNLLFAFQVQQDGMWVDLATSQIKISITTNQGAKVCNLTHLDIVAAANQHAWGSYSWAATSNAMRRAVLHAIDAALSSTAYLERISFGFAEAAEVPHDIKPQRFKTLNTLLHDQVLAKMLEQAFANCKPVLVQMVHDTFNYCHETRPTAADMFQVLDSCMRGCILQHIQACLGGLAKPESVPEGFKIEEDAATAELRSGLISKIGKLQEASNTIRLIAGSGVTSDAKAAEPCDASATVVQHVHSEQDDSTADFCFIWPDDDVDITTVSATRRRKKLKRPSNDQDCDVKRPASTLR